MAADPTGYSLDINSLKRIGRAVREVETNQKLPPTTNRRSRFNGPMVEGIMLENLDGTNDTKVPTKARMQIKTGLQANDEWADDPQPSILTIWNRTTTAVSIDQVVFAKELYPDRWHLIVGGGGSGVFDIEFTVISMDCYTTPWILTVEVTWFTGGCTAPIPDADPYTGYVEIQNRCNIADHFTDVNIVGLTGTATYRYPRTGSYCTPSWRLDDICGEGECPI